MNDSSQDKIERYVGDDDKDWWKIVIGVKTEEISNISIILTFVP